MEEASEIGEVYPLQIRVMEEPSEIGEPPEIEKKTITWADRFGEAQPRRRELWMDVSRVSFLSSSPFSFPLYFKLEQINEAYYPLLLFVCSILYIWLLTYVAYARDPLPYALPRRHKKLLESAFVAVSSCWTYCYRDGDVWMVVLVLVLFFNVIPMLNLWWNFENFGFADCCLIIAIDAAVLCCRNSGGLTLWVVAGVGVAVELIKEDCRRYCSQKIKNSRQKLLV